jgi:peptidoglycan/xylan/chitin deacetylase (PgdA/CDA1 family)
MPVLVSDLGNVSQPHEPIMLTFDDGGISGHTHISDVLDQYGG